MEKKEKYYIPLRKKMVKTLTKKRTSSNMPLNTIGIYLDPLKTQPSLWTQSAGNRMRR
jgi:hypothetical protein